MRTEIASWGSAVDEIHGLLATGGGVELEPAVVLQAALVALERLHETLLWAEVRAVVRGPSGDWRCSWEVNIPRDPSRSPGQFAGGFSAGAAKQ